MKGTIDASIPDAYEKLLIDEKEIAEHYTIVDLIRNDLSIVAKKVRVNNFRYFELISSKNGKLWQTSSNISGLCCPLVVLLALRKTVLAKSSAALKITSGAIIQASLVFTMENRLIPLFLFVLLKIKIINFSLKVVAELPLVVIVIMNLSN
jgi:hypothetical protein